jgi:hypothetical protein
MVPLAIEKATRRLGPPEGVDSSDCGNLMIRDAGGNLGNTMWSAWEPTAAELAVLNSGGKIYLGIVGLQHPPIILAAGHMLFQDDAADQT